MIAGRRDARAPAPVNRGRASFMHIVRSAGGVTKRRRDRGATLIEVVVAVAILAILILPTARIVIETGSASNQARLRAEASALATSTMEYIQNESAFGTINTQAFPFSTHADPTWPRNVVENGTPLGGGNPTKDTFQVASFFRIEPSAGGSSVCSSIGAAASPPQIYRIWTDVSWPGDGGDPAVETTYIAPEQGGNVPVDAGELAVPLETSGGGIFNTVSVDVTIVGTKTGSPTLIDTAQSGSGTGGGCAVFDNLDPSYNWEVWLGDGILSNGSPVITPPTNVVTSEELGGLVNGSATTTASYSESAPSLVVGSTVEATPIEVGQPANVGITFQTLQCVGTNTTCVAAAVAGSPVPAAAGLTVTASASELTGPDCGTVQTFAFDTAGAGSITSVGLFPYTDYTLFAGDTSDSCPLYAAGSPVAPVYPGLSPVVLGSQTSVALPVYATELTTGAVAPPSGVLLTATHVQPPATDPAITLSAFGVGNLSATGLPLGEYTLGATGGHTVSPQDIWVTPTAVWFGSAAATTPSALGSSEPSGTPIPVKIT